MGSEKIAGLWNTGTGFEALSHLTAGNQNTATGLRTLFSDINGGFNTATGVLSLFRVAETNPDLVVRDEKGEIYTVRYEAVKTMLLNEFLKEHRKVEQQAREMQEQKTAVSQLKSTVAEQQVIIAQQQKGMEAVTIELKEQASQIQKVSAQLEARKPAPQVVNSR